MGHTSYLDYLLTNWRGFFTTIPTRQKTKKSTTIKIYIELHNYVGRYTMYRRFFASTLYLHFFFFRQTLKGRKNLTPKFVWLYRMCLILCNNLRKNQEQEKCCLNEKFNTAKHLKVP